MRLYLRIFLFLIASTPVAGVCQIQSVTPAAKTLVNPQVAPSARPHKVMVKRPPAQMLPTGLARLSTAQRAALRGAKPLPNDLPVFSVFDSNGKAVASPSFQRSTHWLLLYRQETCLPCDRLMTGLAASSSPNLQVGLPYVIVVAGSTAQAGENVRTRYSSTLGNANWLTDTTHSFSTALKPRGTPMLYGMEGTHIVWALPGTLGEPAHVEKMASAWLASSPVTVKTTTATQTVETQTVATQTVATQTVASSTAATASATAATTATSTTTAH